MDKKSLVYGSKKHLIIGFISYYETKKGERREGDTLTGF